MLIVFNKSCKIDKCFMVCVVLVMSGHCVFAFGIHLIDDFVLWSDGPVIKRA